MSDERAYYGDRDVLRRLPLAPGETVEVVGQGTETRLYTQAELDAAVRAEREANIAEIHSLIERVESYQTVVNKHSQNPAWHCAALVLAGQIKALKDAIAALR